MTSLGRLSLALPLALLLSAVAGCGGSEQGTSSSALCNPTPVPLSQQVANPIAYLSSNNNGLMLQFPYLSTTYANSVTGYAVFGVATQANNTPATAPNITAGTIFNTVPADTNINDNCFSFFQTQWDGGTICGFLDSGSEALTFPNLTSSPISYDANTNDATYDFYTPASSTGFSATNVGYGGSPSVVTSFNIENVNSQFSSFNVFSQWGVVESGGVLSGDFDWGLPFFLGRTVFVGLENKTSSLGSGNYWSYPTTLYTPALTVPAGTNVMPVTIGGYGNEPYVSVTICVPGTLNCATVPNVLLDTGSSGLRLFSSALPPSFVNQLGGSSLGDCVSYGDNSVQWGAVVPADVMLGQQTASNVPIHIINNSFKDGGASCYNNLASLYLQDGFVDVTCPISTTASQSADPNDPYFGCPFYDSPSTFYNGILGVNFLAQDCGAACASNPTYIYYSCGQ